MNLIRLHVDKKFNFVTLFAPGTGGYARTGMLPQASIDNILNKFKKDMNNDMDGCIKYMIEQDSKYSKGDSFMASFPHLLDIGIMGYCSNEKRCEWCYQDSKSTGKHMSLETYKKIIDESKDKVFQIALGGAGSPNDHPDFRKICKYTREAGIIPNYTTQGENLTQEQVNITKKYCGAVAVSCYTKKKKIRIRRKLLK